MLCALQLLLRIAWIAISKLNEELELGQTAWFSIVETISLGYGILILQTFDGAQTNTFQ